MTHKPTARLRNVQLVCSSGRRTNNEIPLWDLVEMRLEMLTHKPTARPMETPSGMLVDSDLSVSWATSKPESAAMPRLELSIGLHVSA